MKEKKVAVITGGSRGIGFATADAFLKEGATVIIAASSQASADKAVSKLQEKYPDIKLYLGGIWEDPSLQEEASKCGSCVEWLGWVDGEKKAQYLKECDVFVLPTYFEGQPVALLEAMAASCAPVVSETGGIPMMITGEENGIFIQPRDACSLEEGLDRVLADEALCRRLGKAARARVEKDFSLEDNMNKLLEIYERVMN